jgi:hypothetical protein
MNKEKVLCEERFPAGGFVLVSVAELCLVWSAFRLGKIQLRDLRAWLACREMLARRCAAAKQQRARYSVQELQRLVGGAGGKHLERSLRCLEKQKLLIWTESALVFQTDWSKLDEDLRHAAQGILAALTNTRRRVPAPRRILRWLAGGAGRTMTATVLGHLLRCLYGSAVGCRPVGTCKASWVATVFGVNARAVKRARAELTELGWLQPQATPQWHRNRYGLRVGINLRWAPQGAERQKSLPLAPIVTEKSPPVPNKKLLAEYKNQKPARSGPAGLCSREGTNKKPTLRNVTLADLQKPERLMELFQQAVGADLISASESERLGFFAAAEHARAVASRNAPGLFCFLVRQKKWHFCSQPDEDQARRKLQALAEQAQSGKVRAAPPGANPMVQSILQAWAGRSAFERKVA